MNTKQRKYSFIDDEACEDDSRNFDFGISDEGSEEDDFLDEKHYLSQEDSDSVIEITPLRASTAKRTRALKDAYPKQRLSHSKIIKIKEEKEEDIEIGWESDEIDELMQTPQSPVLDHKKFRIVPSSLRLIIPQEPIIVFPRSQNDLSSLLKGKVFIGIDPGVRNLGVSVFIPDLAYHRNSTHSIVKNTLQTSFDYNSVTTMLAIGVKVDSIMEEEVLNVLASLNTDYVWEDLVLCIEGQYVMTSAGPKTVLFQRLLLLACRLEMSFLDWCVRKHKGLHIQRTSSQRASSMFLKERPHCWNIICELNKQVFSGVSKDRFTKEYVFAGCKVIPESILTEDISKMAKKPKAMRVVNLLWEIKLLFSDIPEEDLPVFLKLPFASALTDHEADANLSLVVAILDILKIQTSKQC